MQISKEKKLPYICVSIKLKGKTVSNEVKHHTIPGEENKRVQEIPKIKKIIDKIKVNNERKDAVAHRKIRIK
jgi:hypothetical protein